MTSWRDSVLLSFTPEIARLTVCADPDGILAEEALLAEIRARGFDLLIFTEPVSFRFAYEARYRAQWDSGEQSDLVVIVSGSPMGIPGKTNNLLRAQRHLPSFEQYSSVRARSE